MKNTSQPNEALIPPVKTNYTTQGSGPPVILIHGLAASLHDWDDLVPELVGHGYAAHALDLLGHGDSHKPGSRLYQVAWVTRHLSDWIDSLGLHEPAVLVGHSLGGYLALDLARRFPGRVRALVLVDPFYRLSQLPAYARLAYQLPFLNMSLFGRAPTWLVRLVIDLASLSMGHSSAGAHGLPARIRAQTAIDYGRTASGAYHLISSAKDIQPGLKEIHQPCLLVWGSRDTTLAPASFDELAAALPHVTTRVLTGGHVPHQSNAQEFNRSVLDFLDHLRAA